MSKRLIFSGLGICLVWYSTETGFLRPTETSAAERERRAAVAGVFYPDNPEDLISMVDRLLSEVPRAPEAVAPVALISPHAGYVFSGPVAAHAYARLRGRGIERVVIISPSHITSFRGASVYDGARYWTPLGGVEVDRRFCERLASGDPLIKSSSLGHVSAGRGEHALEVQLPFLQRVLGEFQLVPVIMGEQSLETCRALGVAVAALCKDTSTVIIASSDLSHFHSYQEAKALDRQVVNAIEKGDYLTLIGNFSLNKWEACGGGPIVAAMIAAERLGAGHVEILKYANSGDVPQGGRDRVVGYVAAAFYASDREGTLELETLRLGPEEKEQLLRIARHSVESAVRTGESPKPTGRGLSNLEKEAATFVTLTKHGELRGCVGSILATQPLVSAVADAAVGAALNDHRFPPVSRTELGDLEYEISVLSRFKRVADPELIQVGEHGLLIEKGRYRGLLLPQVATDRNWDRKTFLEQTCVKAGLHPQAWKDPETEIYAFSATVFGEHE
jgi:AmmeMemoRadiSam system protein B/AmmeMemoRadiSam system protein A